MQLQRSILDGGSGLSPISAESHHYNYIISSSADRHSNRKTSCTCKTALVRSRYRKTDKHQGKSSISNGSKNTENNVCLFSAKTSPCVGTRWVTTFHLTLFNPGPRRGFFHITPERVPEVWLKGGRQTSGEAIHYLERRLGGNRDSLLSARQPTGWIADVGAAGQTDVMEATRRQVVPGRRICVRVCIVATPGLPPTLLSRRGRGRLEELDTCKSNTSTSWGHCGTNKQTSLCHWLALPLIKAARLGAKVSASDRSQLMCLFIYFFWLQFSPSFSPRCNNRFWLNWHFNRVSDSIECFNAVYFFGEEREHLDRLPFSPEGVNVSDAERKEQIRQWRAIKPADVTVTGAGRLALYSWTCAHGCRGCTLQCATPAEGRGAVI